jgi:hypothetical protein
MNTIPASAIVAVQPSVISAGGSGLDLSGLVLTQSVRVPIGQILSFPSAPAVAKYFGATSTEAAKAAIYFGGFTGSNILPGAMLFAQYNTSAVAAYLNGGNVSGLTLAQLQALSGTLTITVNGTAKTSSAINLSSVTSFSNAASTILAGFTSPNFTVAYDSVSGGFIFTSTTSGTASTISFASGTLAASLLLTSATGAFTSQGAAAVASPAAFMNSIIAQTTNFATFMHAFDPDNGSGNAQKLAFATWNGQQNNRYIYSCADTDVSPTVSASATSSLGYLIAQAQISGTALHYDPQGVGLDAFFCGSIASIDFTQKNGRITMAFKSQSGLSATVTDPTSAANLIANGYNFYGAYATANDEFIFYYPGSISGSYKWADAYANQIWLNNAFQLALMELLTQMKSVPYNDDGYGLLRAACMDPINAGLNFGAFNAGVPLSSAQAAEVNNAAGMAIDKTLSSQGWYLQILPAAAQVRGNRTSPPMTFWYMDGGSVQNINLASVEVQ